MNRMSLALGTFLLAVSATPAAAACVDLFAVQMKEASSSPKGSTVFEVFTSSRPRNISVHAKDSRMQAEVGSLTPPPKNIGSLTLECPIDFQKENQALLSSFLRHWKQKGGEKPELCEGDTLAIGEKKCRVGKILVKPM